MTPAKLHLKASTKPETAVRLGFPWPLRWQLHDAGAGRARRVLCRALVSAALLPAASPCAHAQATPAPATRAPQGSSEIDLFMERVLDNRDASWRRLGDFILRETETFTFDASLGIPLSGFRHEYEWYVRDDVVVRSPIRFDGVQIDEETRREYEADWLRQERRPRGRRNGRSRRISRRATADNIAIAIERSWGDAVSEPLLDRIAADADLLGDDQAAITLNTGAILAELGGVDVVGFGAAVVHTRDLFVMLETERLTSTEVARALRRPLARLVDRIDLARADALEEFVELAELGARFELDARDLGPYFDRASRRLAARGHDGVAATLDQIRRRLVARGGEPPGSGQNDTNDRILLDRARLEPRFISQSDFMEFTFEPGNYYFVGRETLVGREVVKIEYYPTDLFDDGRDAPGSALDARIDLGFNKTSLVTLWIDPEAFQIVQYTFDNTGLDFLPGRWLVRVDDVGATMQMGQPLGDVWVPIRMTVFGRVTTALGDLDLAFTRDFFDYREAETGVRLIDAGEPGRR
jgi:hypothetical protein